MSRLRDSQLGDERVKDIHNYIVKGVLWEAFTAEQPVVLLIDEIDKADIEFPNDLLREIDRMEFYVYETREPSRRAPPAGVHHPNNEKEAADAFLRRCFFHYIRFPTATMQRSSTFTSAPEEGPARRRAEELLRRAQPARLKKKPSTSELLDWLKLLVAEDIPLEALQTGRQGQRAAARRRAAEERGTCRVEKLVFAQRHNR